MRNPLSKISAFVVALAVITVTHAAVLEPAKPKCAESNPAKACTKMCDDWRAGGGGTFEANCQDCCKQMGQGTGCWLACSNAKTPCTCRPKAEPLPIEP